MDRFRVVQWGTGPVGRHALRAMIERPNLELVGVWVGREVNSGRDAGELAGVARTGILTTTSIDDILALEAECVYYAGRAQRELSAVLDDICRLLRSGKNVISTTASSLIYPKSAGAEVWARLEEACQAGGVSFHGTGLEPGWASEVLPITLSGLLDQVECLSVQEIMDYTTYDNPRMLFDFMGFGREPAEERRAAKEASVMPAFVAPLMMVAEAVGAEVDDYRFHFETALAEKSFRIPAGSVAEGTVSAMRFGVSAMIAGRAALIVEHITRVGEGQAPQWPQGRGWRCNVKGTPSFRLEMDIAINPGEDDNDHACRATAMHAVNAIKPVCTAPPGVRTFLDLPVIAGSALFGRRLGVHQ